MDLLADILLVMSHPAVVASLFIIGYFYHDRTMWIVAATLALCSLVINPCLKEYFQMPRPLGQTGFGFPSGHFHGSFVFYGWLALHWNNKWIRLGILMILAGIGFGLVQKGYHFPRDLLGSAFFGSILILSTKFAMHFKLFKTYPNKITSLYTLVLGTPLLFAHLRINTAPEKALLGLILLITFSSVLSLTTGILSLKDKTN